MSLEVEGLNVELNGNRVVSQVSLTVNPGEIVSILGPNGAGKSSLLRAIAGEWRASSGTVALSRRALSAWPLAELAQTMGVLPQRSNLDFAFRVREVVMLGRIPHSSGHEIDRHIVTEALAMLDAAVLSERLYTELSGGERQRVQLARVLAQVWQASPYGPRLLLLDEPTASFDLAHQKLLGDIIRAFAQQDVATLVVLHDLNLAAAIADTMIMLKHGKIRACGTPHEVMNEKTIREVFDVDVVMQNHPRLNVPTALL